ncbi:PTS system mannose/fructose/sorbose family transporter subunit IID [bacterium]|nr:PTS system mannose/fructose/sorbose family transporter subunit IID [bacterium]
MYKILVNYMFQLFIQNGWNFHNEQRIGMTLALSIRNKGRIVSIPRNTLNTHPYLASFLAGVLLKENSGEKMEEISSLLETSLAAQGDDLYWRLLRPAALLISMGFVLFGQPLIGMLVFFLGFNAFAQGERLVGFKRGLEKGKEALVPLLTSLSKIKKIVLIVAGVILGFLVSLMLFILNNEHFLFARVEWFIFLPLFAVSLFFSILKIPFILGLFFNLAAVIVVGFMI